MDTMDLFSSPESDSDAAAAGSAVGMHGLIGADEDFFATQGSKDLCVALLRQAACDLSHGLDTPEGRETVAWLNGADSPIPYETCLTVLGVEEWESAIRDKLLEAPRVAMHSLTSFLQTTVWVQKTSASSVLADEAQVIASYRSTSRPRG